MESLGLKQVMAAFLLFAFSAPAFRRGNRAPTGVLIPLPGRSNRRAMNAVFQPAVSPRRRLSGRARRALAQIVPEPPRGFQAAL